MMSIQLLHVDEHLVRPFARNHQFSTCVPAIDRVDPQVLQSIPLSAPSNIKCAPREDRGLCHCSTYLNCHGNRYLGSHHLSRPWQLQSPPRSCRYDFRTVLSPQPTTHSTRNTPIICPLGAKAQRHRNSLTICCCRYLYTWVPA